MSPPRWQQERYPFGLSFAATVEGQSADRAAFTISTWDCADIWEDRNALFGRVSTIEGPVYLALGEVGDETLITLFELVGVSVHLLAGRKATIDEGTEYVDYRGPTKHAKYIESYSGGYAKTLSDFCDKTLSMDVVVWNTTFQLNDEDSPLALTLDAVLAERVRSKALSMGLSAEAFVRHCISRNL